MIHADDRYLINQDKPSDTALPPVADDDAAEAGGKEDNDAQTGKKRKRGQFKKSERFEKKGRGPKRISVGCPCCTGLGLTVAMQ